MQSRSVMRRSWFWIGLVPILLATQRLDAGQAVQIEPTVKAQIKAQGQSSFWVVLREQADLQPAFQIKDWKARGDFVYQRLVGVATRTQPGLRGALKGQGVPHKPAWIINAIHVTGNQKLLNELAARPEVSAILGDHGASVPKPIAGNPQNKVNGIEWNIDRINAPAVWAAFGTRGEGIVVCNIDTGVQFDHPAVVSQYRGSLGGGVFDHNYNWYDPSGICGAPSLQPCDNVGHGTHTMGTMVGDDGAANQIGVAPGARWIAAKGCESNSCSDYALIAAAEWILAPTDLNGLNPRPDLRPHIVNNSWGGGGGNAWYEYLVQAWIASGIFPAFSIGNAGSSCATAGSPGDYPESYASGAFDINNWIAWFSSRGPSFWGETKPNLAAPGADVRSSVPNNDYAWYSGTSMASPHTAATVALVWAAAPSLVGDIAATRTLLDLTAIDVADLSCGGLDPDNNVWGEGRLDAYAAVDLAPKGPLGMLQGTVTDLGTGLPVPGAQVQVAGPTSRSTITDGTGFYQFSSLPVGAYDVTASAFGYLTQTAGGVMISDGAMTVQDLALIAAPSHSVSGFVYDGQGNALAHGKVTLLNTSIPPAITGPDGAYAFASVPEGTYDVRAEAGCCNDPLTQPLVVAAPVTDFNFVLPRRTDAFGYYCEPVMPAYLEANNVLPIVGDDGSIEVPLPFPFTFYGRTYPAGWVSLNGFLSFFSDNSFAYWNEPIPTPWSPNGAIYAFWDDLYVGDGWGPPAGEVRTDTMGTAPDRKFVVEWRNVRRLGYSEVMDVEIVLFENGRILMQYRNVPPLDAYYGIDATIGLENESGTIAFQSSYNQPVVTPPEMAVLYRLPPSAFVEGHVTDFNDGLPLAKAKVQLFNGGGMMREETTDADGYYRIFAPLGEYTLQASVPYYATGSAAVSLVDDGTVYTRDFALKTARAEVTPPALEFLVPLGESRTKVLTLRNAGSLDLIWEIKETGGGRVAQVVRPARVANYDPDARTTKALFVNDVQGWAPQAAGDILKAWTPTGMGLAWGVGYRGNVWLSDVVSLINWEWTTDGAATGVQWPTPWAGAWPGDMAYDSNRGWMCQVNVGGDNGIYCWNPASGEVMASFTGPWSWVSQRGLAYRPDDDTFYVGGWNEGIIYHIKGLGWDVPGEVLGIVWPPDPTISGLAWNPAFKVLWMASNSPTDTLYALNPDTGEVIATLAHPTPFYNGAGLEMDDAGNLWMIAQNPNTVYLVDSGIPAFSDVPWLSEEPAVGVLAPGTEQAIQVTVNTAGLEPGIYSATLFLVNNGAKTQQIKIPVRVVVPAYFVGVNTGGKVYIDGSGETWFADKAYAVSSWGYIGKSTTSSTRKAIAGTLDDPLYQDARNGGIEYRFDVPVAGVYDVELRFAEIQNLKAGQRQFDVILEGNLVLPAYDIAAEAGSFRADDHKFTLKITDGQVNLRFAVRRSFKEPIINAIRVIHRPDL